MASRKRKTVAKKVARKATRKTVKKTVKKAVRPLGTEKVSQQRIAALSGQEKLRLLVWDAYANPSFFTTLINARQDLALLKGATGNYAFTDAELKALQERLMNEKAEVNLAQFMSALQTYTRPNMPRTKIVAMLGRLVPPWAPWDPILTPEVEGTAAKKA